MTAEEQLRERVERLTEEEAAATMRLLDQRTDDLTRMLEEAPMDDESTTPEEEAAVQEALEAVARGETISLEELRAELDAERRWTRPSAGALNSRVPPSATSGALTGRSATGS